MTCAQSCGFRTGNTRAILEQYPIPDAVRADGTASTVSGTLRCAHAMHTGRDALEVTPIAVL